MVSCPCGSLKSYKSCCELFISGEKLPETAEALMRSRYSAFAKAEIDYLIDTIHPDKRKEFDRKSVVAWAKKSEWLDFKLLDTQKGGSEDSEGQVEFIAEYRQKGKRRHHHELAQFKRADDRWYFYDGAAPEIKQVVRETAKIGRNDPCSCGSGKKYKKCCAK